MTSLKYPHLPPDLAVWQTLRVPMSRSNFHGPRDVRTIEVRLYILYFQGQYGSSSHLPSFIYKANSDRRTSVYGKVKTYKDNPLYTDTRYNNKIRYNDKFDHHETFA